MVANAQLVGKTVGSLRRQGAQKARIGGLIVKANTLYYDPNELRSGVPQALPSAESDAELLLDYGWKTCDGMLVLVERKSLDDLAHSLRSGHLKMQLEGAKKATNHVWLLCEEFPVSANDLMAVSGQWEYSAFLAALYSILCGLQVLLVPALNRYNCAPVLWTLFQQTKRESLGSGRPPLPKWRWTEHNAVAESFSRAIPGLGFQRAKALEKVCPSWEALLKANEAKLKRTDGIGEVLAARIYDFLRRTR